MTRAAHWGSVTSVELTLNEIIELTNGRVVAGESCQPFTGVASLDEAGVNQVSFLGNEKYYQDYLVTEAGVVLVPSIVEQYPPSAVVVEVENPSFAFSLVMKKLAAQQRVFKAGVHPSAWVAEDVSYDPEKVSIKAGAVVESGVTIGDGTEIGTGVCLNEGVKLGADCLIHSNVTVREYCEIGDRVILQPGCVIGSDGYGYEMVDGRHQKIDQVGIVVLENDVEVGANATIDRARFGKTRIGEGSKVDNLVQIAHNVKVGKHCLIVALTGVAGSAELGDYVTCAAQVGIAGHIKVGDKSLLLGRTGVTKSLEGDQKYWGFPVKTEREEKRLMVSQGRIPQLVADVKSLKKEVAELTGK